MNRCCGGIVEICNAYSGTDELIQKVWEKIYKRGDVDEQLYLHTANKLFEAVEVGSKKSIFEFDFSTPEGQLVNQIRKNVFVFSAAKDYHQIRKMSNALLDENNKLRSFPEFKKECLKINITFTERYLNAEYSTAITGARNAADWSEIQRLKKVFPYLKYQAVMDTRTSEICQDLNGTIKPVDDDFWGSFTPPNHWGVERAQLVKIRNSANEDIVTPKNKTPKPKVQPIFNNNTGKTGILFPDTHPFYKTHQLDKEIAKKNFGLKIPELEVTNSYKKTFRNFIKSIEQGKARGNVGTVGFIEERILKIVKAKGYEVNSQQIIITDSKVNHALRTVKKKLGHAVTEKFVTGLPSSMKKYDALFWDIEKKNLVYVFKKENKLIKVIVQPNYKSSINKKKQVINSIVTMGTTDLFGMNNKKSFELIDGGL